MRIWFYAPPFDVSARALFLKLAALDGVLHSKFIGSLNDLFDHLRRPKGLPTIGILWPAGGQELVELNSIRDFFSDMRIVLILPDHQNHTVSNAHLLRPRYISYADGDLSDVAAVVGKMVAPKGLPPAQLMN